MSRSGLKYQIEQELLKNDWRIISTGANREWWDDEHWEIRTERRHTERIFICFIVDPAHEGPRKQGEGIWEVKACTQFPSAWNDQSNEVASIQISSRGFEQRLSEFIERLHL